MGQLEEGEIPPESSRGNQQITTFFISNLPDGVTSQDLKGELGRCGQLTDAYVARKKDKFGKIFAFVRFSKVKDIDKLMKALNNQDMYGRKVYARVARFSKEDSRSRSGGGTRGGSSRDKDGSGTTNDRRNDQSEEIRVGKQTMSYDYGNQSYWPNLTREKEERTGTEAKCVQFDDKAAAIPKAWIDKAVVVVARNYYRLCNLMTGLKEVKGLRMEVRYLGGLKVLLSFSGPEKVSEFLSQTDKWGEWLSSVCEWQGQILDYERLTWLKITGLPLIIRSEENVEKIAATYGQIVRHVENAMADTDLSGAYVGVSVKCGKRIDEEIKVKWRNEVFSCCFSEGSGRWVPDFVNDKVVVIGSDNILHQSPVKDFESQSAEPMVVEIMDSTGAKDQQGKPVEDDGSPEVETFHLHGGNHIGKPIHVHGDTSDGTPKKSMGSAPELGGEVGQEGSSGENAGDIGLAQSDPGLFNMWSNIFKKDGPCVKRKRGIVSGARFGRRRHRFRSKVPDLNSKTKDGEGDSSGSRGEKKKRRRRRSNGQSFFVQSAEVYHSNGGGGIDDGFESDWVEETNVEVQNVRKDSEVLGEVPNAGDREAEMNATIRVGHSAGLLLEGFEDQLGKSIEDELGPRESK